MKRFAKTGLPLVLLFAAVAAPVSAEDLLQVYDLAVLNDPLFREAEATRNADKEARPQAIGALLPQITGSASTSKRWNNGTSISENFVEGVGVTTFDNSGNSQNQNQGWGFALRQSVFSYANWTALRTSNHVVAQAEANYLAASQNLAQRVAQQYFQVLAVADDVVALESSREAIQRQLEQAERRFEVGLIAITDVQENRAGRDQAAAAVIASKRLLASALEQLRATIGVKPEVLKKPVDAMPLVSPDPANEEDWVKASMEQNAELISSRLAADIARDQVHTAFSGHLPTVDLVAGRTFDDGDGSSEFPNGNTGASETLNYGKTIALQLQLPLFTGGSTHSRVKQSQYRWIAAKERLERTSRTTEQLARDAYLGVISEIERVRALRQAVESSETALRAAEAGYDVGTRTTVDVLNARRNLIQAQTNYSQSRYAYINNQVQLRLAAGDLTRDSIVQINQHLLVDAPVGSTARSPTPVAPPAATPAAPAAPAAPPPPAN